MKTTYFVVPAPGYYGDRATVISSHRTLRAALRAARLLGNHVSFVVRCGPLRRGHQWLRSMEQHYPPALGESWVDLSCGGRVLVQQGRPVRVSDRGRTEVTEAQILHDLAQMGWPKLSVREWNVGDEHDATAIVC
jgi:hypothetical protein